MAKPQPLDVELPADLAQPFVVPEDATTDVIEATVAAIKKNANALLDDTKRHDASPAERIAKAEWLITATETLEARKGEIVAQQEAEAQRMADVRNRLGDAPVEDSTDDSTEDDDDEHRDDEPGDQEGGSGQGAPAQLAPAEPVLVASAGRRSALADVLAGRAGDGATGQAPAPVQSREAYLTAAGGVTGYTPGAKLNWDELGVAAEDRFRSLPDGVDGGPFTKLAIGKVHVPADPGLVASKQVAISERFGGKGTDLDEAIEWAISRKRLARDTGTDGSLVAAAGWCAPSETLYDLVDITSADGLVDLPGITVNRGGVRYSLGPDFGAVYSAGQNFTQTEAQNIANTVKPVVNIPCPAFTDNRMLVDGLMLTGDILAAKGYPEAYADFTRKALKAFEHYVNAKSIADMVTLAGTVIDLKQAASSPTFYENKSVATELLGAVELQIIDMRYRNRMSLTDEVELVFPYWVVGTIRSDIAKRAAQDDPASVTNQQIADWFALRGARVQWVYDWQDYFAAGAGFGAAAAATSWPTTVRFLLYPRGGFVRALSDVIELNAIYDSTLLRTNQYVALFLERARLVLKRVPDVRCVETKVLVTGATGVGFDYTAAQPNV